MAPTQRTFPAGGSVPAADLVGREAVLTELFERSYGHGNSLLLSAPRQTGKTSIADELARRIRRAGGWAIYIDCSAATDDERELAELIARTTYDQASGSKGAFSRLKDLLGSVPRPMLYQNDADLALSFYGPKRESVARLLERALSLADELAVQKKKRTVVIYDEFQRLRVVSPSIFDRIRAVLQHHMNNTAYLFMGSEVGILDELFKSRSRMPFRLASPVMLARPTDEEWRIYVESRFRSLRMPLAPGEANVLIQSAGGHPRDLMEMCEHLLTIRSIAPQTANAVELARARTLDGLRANFDEIWKHLERPKGTRTTALRIARSQPVYGHGRPAAAVQRTVAKLETEGVIRKIGRGSYEFTEPLFGEFVRELGSS